MWLVCFDWTECFTKNPEGHLSATTGHTLHVLLLCILAEIYGSQMGDIVKLCFALFAPWSLLGRHSLHVNAFRAFFFSWRKKGAKRSERYLSRPQAHESRLAGVTLYLM